MFYFVLKSILGLFSICERVKTGWTPTAGQKPALWQFTFTVSKDQQ